MLSSKSYAEFALGALQALLVDCASYYPGLRKEFDRDYNRLSSAVESHGLRFITETMPAYRKHFDKCLDERRLTPIKLFHFGTVRKGSTIPRLFRGLMLRVFDSNGVLRSDPDYQAIRLIRQLLGAFRKMRVDCGTEARYKAVLEFIKVDGECHESTLNWVSAGPLSSQDVAPSTLNMADGIASNDDSKETTPDVVTSDVLARVQDACDYVTSALGHFDPYVWRPRHGPGAVSDHRFGSYKYEFDRWTDRLDTLFPVADFALSSYAQLPENVAETGFLHSSDEVPAKMACVPKTTKTPRLIACEPTSAQWCQQIIRDYLYRRVQQTSLSKFIDFYDQAKNAKLALEASSRQSHWTIDLSSASDRISCWHAERLFRRNPYLLDCLWATRSQTLTQDIVEKLPRVIHLKKFSTMGNGTTFPVQSLFFLSIVLGCMSYTRRAPVAKIVKQAPNSEVRIFGDDLIVPKDVAPLVVNVLHALKLRVNVDKTFGGLGFRESCGTDAFNGYDVTTVSILDVPQRTRPGSVASTVDVHNNQLKLGFDACSQYLRKAVERMGFVKIPNVAYGSGCFGWQTFGPVDNSHLKSRWNADLCQRQVRAITTRVVAARTSPETSAGYLQYFIEAAGEVTSAISSLGYLTGRPQTKLGLRWIGVSSTSAY